MKSVSVDLFHRDKQLNKESLLVVGTSSSGGFSERVYEFQLYNISQFAASGLSSMSPSRIEVKAKKQTLESILSKAKDSFNKKFILEPVSYTHLTLPTICSV